MHDLQVKNGRITHQRHLFTSGNLEQDSLAADKQQVGSLELVEAEFLAADKQQVCSLELVEAEVDNHHMLAAHIQHWVDMADQTLTFAELVALPLVAVQTFRLSCPSQPCAESVGFKSISKTTDPQPKKLNTNNLMQRKHKGLVLCFRKN